jgi:hypothetical protein
VFMPKTVLAFVKAAVDLRLGTKLTEEKKTEIKDDCCDKKTN